MMNFSACKRDSVDTVMIESAQDMLETVQDLIEQRVKIFALLGNKVRYKILFLLLHVERVCVCDLADILEMNQSPISQHLRKLKDAGILENKREGMTIYYSIASSHKVLLEEVMKGECE